MTYTALYRKLRPINFDGIIGQDHIVKTLSNQIKSDRISHAYLFTGTRGTGKTSVAKIFARGVNCENNKDGTPCGECDFCKMSSDQAAMVIYEIDAASNNGVDNIRDLINTVKYPPPSGRYKVYIIDEVHMLSTGAFNALLKTLEEPPEHVIFILATTEPHKIPLTIHSRCQRFDFKRILAKDIAETIKGYMDNEGIDIDDDAIKYVARIADGAMRDALSIIDQCLAYFYGEKITLEKIMTILGSVSSDYFFSLADCLYLGDSMGCIKMIEKIVEDGKDLDHFLSEFIVHIRNLLVVSSVDSDSAALDYSIENIDEMKKQSEKIDKETALNYLNVFSELQSKMKYAANKRILFEAACLKICNSKITIREDNIAEDIEKRFKQLELSLMSKLEKKTVKIDNSTVITSENHINIKDKEEAPKKKLEKAIPEDIKKVIKEWESIIELASKDDLTFGAMLEQCFPKYIDGENVVCLVCDNDTVKKMIEKNKEILQEKLSEKYKKDFQINIFKEENYEKEHVKVHGQKDTYDYDSIKEFVSKLPKKFAEELSQQMK